MPENRTIRFQAVAGYRADRVALPALTRVENPDYADSGELVSLARGLAADGDDSRDLVESYGDVIFKRYVLEILDNQQADFQIAVDADWRASVHRARAADHVRCSEPNSRPAEVVSRFRDCINGGPGVSRTP